MAKKSLFRRVVGGVGDVVSKAAPLATFLPGVGPIAAGALGLAGGLAGELNDEDGIQPLKALKSGVWGGVGAYGLDKLAAIPGADRLVTTAGQQVKRAAPLAKNAGGLVKDVGRFAKDNPGLILAGLTAFQGAREGQRAENLQNEALDYARERDAEAKPLRDLAYRQLSAVDLGSDPRIASLMYDPGNPYARDPSSAYGGPGEVPTGGGPGSPETIIPNRRRPIPVSAARVA